MGYITVTRGDGKQMIRYQREDGRTPTPKAKRAGTMLVEHKGLTRAERRSHGRTVPNFGQNEPHIRMDRMAIKAERDGRRLARRQRG